ADCKGSTKVCSVAMLSEPFLNLRRNNHDGSQMLGGYSIATTQGYWNPRIQASTLGFLLAAVKPRNDQGLARLQNNLLHGSIAIYRYLLQLQRIVFVAESDGFKRLG